MMFNRRRYVGIVVGILVLVLAIIAVIYTINKKSSRISVNQPSGIQSPVTQPPYTSSSSPEETSIPVTPIPTSVPGGTRGQITCNYRIPAAPNQYGSADIESNWNNLVMGKNASFKLAVCVSVNGNSSLMSLDSRTDGSRVDSASWISLKTVYVFTLYDDHGGDLPDCGGIVLSSCELNTNSH